MTQSNNERGIIMTAKEMFRSMAIKMLETFAKFSASNHKLVPNKETAFLIWNLPYKLTCPFATEMCKLKCYAKKAEDLYPDCNPCRNRNWTFSRSADISRTFPTSLSSATQSHCPMSSSTSMTTEHCRAISL